MKRALSKEFATVNVRDNYCGADKNGNFAFKI